MRFFGLFLFSLFLCNSVFSQEKPSVIHIAFEDVANPPRIMNSIRNSHSKLPGLTLELLSLIEKKLNVEFEFTRTPWARCKVLLKSNIADGIFHASYKKEREKFGVYPKLNGRIDASRSVFFRNYAVYVRSDSEAYIEDGQLKNVDGTVSAKIGYSVISDLEKNGLEVDSVKKISNGLDMVSVGRVSAFVDLEEMTDAYIAQNNSKYPNLKKMKIPYRTKAYYLIFSKEFYAKNKKLTEQIWDALAEISSSAEFIKIRHKYLLM
ncbi:putative ABC-type amino acid transport/signal transduction system, periplasmic component/domain [Candidatus Terasakiella magnetica]|uniref:Putative ABC-type amino acid transport/signal transduction system, periplasmic component/domain n=1 Tax=Candidatus Terasakiella magnetica TaxID=1867952 RepID=A0A1C3RDR8_9PROT|nr:transporter substrate-binding domain-containing protein [Candidatus Terasakiella magnetica]SCA55436.1 putative ABC-type amino acid transport/signal transduction system, periplasmic component/domain [Candidatus Terasakiella magnetica]